MAERIPQTPKLKFSTSEITRADSVDGFGLIQNLISIPLHMNVRTEARDLLDSLAKPQSP